MNCNEKNANETSILSENVDNAEDNAAAKNIIKTTCAAIAAAYKAYADNGKKPTSEEANTLAYAIYDFAYVCAYSTIRRSHAIGGEVNEKSGDRKEDASHNTLQALEEVRRDIASGQSTIEAVKRLGVPTMKKRLDVDIVQDVAIAALIECEKLYKKCGEVDFESMYETRRAMTVYISRAADLKKINEPPKYKTRTTCAVKKCYSAACAAVENHKRLVIDASNMVYIDAYKDAAEDGDNGEKLVEYVFFKNKAFSLLLETEDGDNATQVRAVEILKYIENLYKVCGVSGVKRKIVEWKAYGINAAEVDRIRVKDIENSTEEKEVKRPLTAAEKRYILGGYDFNDNLNLSQLAVLLQITPQAVSEHIKALQKKALKAVKNGKLPRYEFMRIDEDTPTTAAK